jgi:hypothetical protein
MFCTKCGNKLFETDKFCTQCGDVLNGKEEKFTVQKSESVLIIDEKWWLRLLKVIYIFLCLQIFWIVPVVWSINSTTYVGGYYGTYKDTPETAFWYSILAVFIYMSLTRLLKIAVLYVSTGKKPQWTREFRKFY